MRRAIRSALAAAVPLVLASCASTTGGAVEGAPEGAPGSTSLTRVGEAVQVTENPESTRECEFIADVALESPRVSDDNAMRELRNEAGRMGANLVLLVMDTRTTVARAEGYLCADQE